MMPMLATVVAQADDLRRACFAGDVETDQLDAGGGAACVNNRPHRLDYGGLLIRRNPQVLRPRPIKASAWSLRSIVAATGISDCRDRSHFFQKMRDVHLASHANCRVSTQQSHRCQHVFTLTER